MTTDRPVPEPANPAGAANPAGPANPAGGANPANPAGGANPANPADPPALAASPLADSPLSPLPPEAPPPSSPFAVVPLSGRAVVSASFELLSTAQRPLRSASFYAGWLALATMGPLALLLWRLESVAPRAFDGVLGATSEPLDGPLGLAFVLAALGYVAVVIDARAIAAAVIAGELERRPVRLAGAVRLARRRFWRLAAAATLVAIPTVIGQSLGTTVAEAVVAGSPAATAAIGVVAGVAASSPFAYALAGVVLGEVPVVESLRRSVRLARLRPRLAITVAGFGVVSQLLLLLALTAGLDVVLRITDAVAMPPGTAGDLAAAAVIAVVVFALGTLLFTAEALAAAPQVHAFVALTHYARGLELARVDSPAGRPWEPWLGRGFAVGVVLGLLVTVAGLRAIDAL